jgi:hypothetical protein
MSSQRRWWVGALGSMIALAAIGSWGCCSVTCCDKKPRNQLILVSPTADAVSTDEAVISKMAHEEIVWKLPDGSTITHIEITPRKPSTPDTLPFENCKVNVKPCRIECQNRLCQSGAISQALNPPRKKLYYYDYGFMRPASAASLDPGIRIDP